MAYHELEEGDEEFLEECPVCGKGYMVPTMGDWYQCSECGIEGKEDDYGIIGYDSSVFGNTEYYDENEDDEDNEDNE